MSCTDISPITAFQNTNLGNRLDDFDRVTDRIARNLGAPLINVEAHIDNLRENLSQACELFSKYAGYTEEYLVFDSNLYTPHKGLKLDELFSITPTFNRINQPSKTVYVALTGLDSSIFATSTTLSATYKSGIYKNQILSNTDYLSVIALSATLTSAFNASMNGVEQYSNAFDFDRMDYRKVIDVYDFEEGSSSNINTLFTIEQSLAQQTYFSYAMGNYGFDLVSWYVLKDWMKNREKMLALKRSYTFDPRTQYLTMHPSPGTSGSSGRFYGVISCYVERPLKDLIKEPWVQQYATALTKITVARVRGKYGGTTLFGGGQLETAMLAEGLNEKKELETMLFQGASPGMGDAAPPMFFVG